jgi:HNH endonuclease
MINNPYVFSDMERDLTKEWGNNLSPRDAAPNWTDPKFDALKAAIKTHYIKAQGRRCSYCARRFATTNHRVWDLDHIVSRDERPEFILEPRNLSAACVDCNNSKRAKKVLRRKIVKYPRTSSAFLIVHPHYDDYDKHIGVVDVVYVGFTPKGRQTIAICELWRYASDALEYDLATVTTKMRKATKKLLDAKSPEEEKLALLEVRFLANLPL